MDADVLTGLGFQTMTFIKVLKIPLNRGTERYKGLSRWLCVACHHSEGT